MIDTEIFDAYDIDGYAPRVITTWTKSNKTRLSNHFKKAVSPWYETANFNSITATTSADFTASVTGNFGLSGAVVAGNIGVTASFRVGISTSATHKIDKKKGKYVRIVVKVDAYRYNVKRVTKYQVGVGGIYITILTKTTTGTLFSPILSSATVSVEYSNTK